MMERSNDIFETLRKVNVNDYVEEKNGLKYLSWSDAWAEVRKRYECEYEVVKQPDGKPYIFDENLGYMVYTKVTIEGLTYEMWLPVMDSNNKAMKAKPYTYKTKYGEKRVEAASMFDVNKAIMRCLVKNLAMFGLGLYIYSGEDLPETDNSNEPLDIKTPEIHEKPKQQNSTIKKLKLKNLKKNDTKTTGDNLDLVDAIIDKQLEESFGESNGETGWDVLEEYYDLKTRGQKVGVDIFNKPEQKRWVETMLQSGEFTEAEMLDNPELSKRFVELMKKMVAQQEGVLQ